MKTNQIIIIVALAIVIIGAMVCDIVRRRKYTPSAQLNELKQPLSIEHATHGNIIDTYTNISQMIPQLLHDIDRAKESYAYLESVVSYATNELYNVYEGEDKYI